MSYHDPEQGFEPDPGRQIPGVYIAVAIAVVVIMALAGTVATVLYVRAGARPAPAPAPSPTRRLSLPDPTGPPSPSPRASLNAAGVLASAGPGELLTWAVADVETGNVLATSSNPDATSTTESMIKPWVGADYLSQHPQATAGRLDEIRRMIRNSDDAAAQDVYAAGGGDLVIARANMTCHLRAVISHDSWAGTTMTASDAARMGACLANGNAAGTEWTPWLITEMTSVEGTVTDQQATTGGGRWGIIDAIPPGHQVAIKNGWTLHSDDGQWHVNCLGIIDRQWALAVMTRYPAALGLPYGAGQCAAVTRELVTG